MAGKGIPTTYPMKANFPGHVLCSGSFRPNGATGIVSGSVKGNGFTVARTSAGLYTVTFDDNHSFPGKVSVLAGVRAADATPTIVQGGDYSEANRTLQLRVLQAAAGGVTEATGFIPIPIESAREIASNDIIALMDESGTDEIAAGYASGGHLVKDSTPLLIRVNGATDKQKRITWAATIVDEIALAAIPIPPDMKASTDIEVHALFQADGHVNSGKTVDCQAFYNGVGAYASDTEMGGNFTLADNENLQELTVTLAAANVGGATPHPGLLSLSLVPAAHANDAIYLMGMWLEYTRADWATTGQVFSPADMAADVDAEVSFAVVVDNDLVAG